MRASGPVLDACPEVAWEQFAVAGAAPRRACRGDRPTPDFREAVYISLTPPSRSTVTLDTPLVVRGAAAGWDATRITLDERAAACGQRGLTAEFFAGERCDRTRARARFLPVKLVTMLHFHLPCLALSAAVARRERAPTRGAPSLLSAWPQVRQQSKARQARRSGCPWSRTCVSWPQWTQQRLRSSPRPPGSASLPPALATRRRSR